MPKSNGPLVVPAGVEPAYVPLRRRLPRPLGHGTLILRWFGRGRTSINLINSEGPCH